MKIKMDEYIEKNKSSIKEDIKTLIAFRSLTESPEETAKALDFVLKRASEMGMQIGKTSDNKAGFAQIGEGEQTIGVLVHVDVVGIGDPMKWTYSPFRMTEAQGYLYGRGIVDDKGPVIMSLYAMKALLDLKAPLHKKIRLIVGTSEESEWSDMDSYKKEFGEPDFGFSPDGEFPIYNIEKGYCDVLLHFKEKALSMFEEISAGDSPNTIPSKAVLKKIGEEPRVFQGTSVHSSVPDQGDNAILKLAAAAEAEGLLFGKFISEFFTNSNHGKPLGIDDGSDLYKGISVGATVASPTVLRLGEDKDLTVNVNVRTKVGTSREDVEASFRKLAPLYGFSFTIRDVTSACMVDPDSEFLKDMHNVYESCGLKGDYKVADGASYAGSMENCVCWGPVFPGEESSAHMENERMQVESMLRATKLYGEYLALAASRSE